MAVLAAGTGMLKIGVVLELPVALRH